MSPSGNSLALALVLLALGLAACGSDESGTIPQSDADALLATVAEIEQDIQARECTSAETDATQFVAAVNDLPKEVGVETKAQLRDAGTRLIELINDQCDDRQETTTTTTTETGATGAFGAEDDG